MKVLMRIGLASSYVSWMTDNYVIINGIVSVFKEPNPG
jgi:hypothetical protein